MEERLVKSKIKVVDKSLEMQMEENLANMMAKLLEMLVAEKLGKATY